MGRSTNKALAAKHYPKNHHKPKVRWCTSRDAPFKCEIAVVK